MTEAQDECHALFQPFAFLNNSTVVTSIAKCSFFSNNSTPIIHTNQIHVEGRKHKTNHYKILVQFVKNFVDTTIDLVK